MSFRGNVNLLEGKYEKDRHDERRTLNSIIKKLSQNDNLIPIDMYNGLCHDYCIKSERRIH